MRLAGVAIRRGRWPNDDHLSPGLAWTEFHVDVMLFGRRYTFTITISARAAG